MSFKHSAVAYLKYFYRAKTIYSVHSPFLYQFVNATLEDKRLFYALEEIEYLRESLLRNNNTITVEDLGAGSRSGADNQRKISSIAKSALSTKAQCHFLFRLCNWLKPKRILELGTSLGISANYMKQGARNTELVTIEGSPEIHKIAKGNLKKFGSSVKCVQSDFDSFISQLDNEQVFDLIYIDGNHTYEATIRYFNILKKHISPNGVILFDDIYWSEGMTKAWFEVKANEEFNTTIDLFDFGLVLNNKSQTESQNHTFIKAIKKPWRIGLWG